ncbi:MAG: hypothetical protein COV80_03885 [Parcubacteria group bacterium CG11_big_fil_rev_8_21_14_0_20_48_46]|nr:MAG: hypothetical protein AUK21_03280 [Parcubacteria group bacterium CG2_30_48_51]PIW78941.1 MAG: hypothetical protein COZ99_03770 [Parcubacteria group bacterium CG_4_8_14_3_um_filter_48_16]PIY78168.1 MAG: hypothetical protein COY83_01260 [Parcubacteria group bacterium CG_4_10_14_0_8_um_filter_48_154]PIZ77875.1 MAG: hypothetical protein COY03_01290 [bacterium CG_4_10_14_0_2_um_filter_48_144]PJC39417.1 MAG: hypothetical protein CO043_04275 [Parcubacteria group bacterium CG_4_9_14_0_2_um_filte
MASDTATYTTSSGRIRVRRGAFLLIGAGFFFVYSWLSFATYPNTQEVWRFNSPDATANFVFARQVALEHTLFVREPLNPAYADVLHPRSVNVLGGTLVPAGFLGLPVLYGALAKVFGVNAIPYFTSAFSVSAIFAFYGFVRRLFSERVAFVSAMLLFMHPVFWYYTSRGLFPNALFVDLCIIGLYFLGSMSPSWKRDGRLSRSVLLCALFAGAGFGMALLVRPAEAFWIFALLLTLWAIYRRIMPLKLVGIFAGILGCFLFLLLALHAAVYGSPLATGYQQLTQAATQDITRRASFGQYLLPFGVDLEMFLVRIFNFVAQFFWWLTVPLILGLISFIARFKEKPLKQKVFFLYIAVLTVYLGLYYSSLDVADTISKEKVTMGTSYLRYWLPFLIAGIPFIVLGLLFILRALRAYGKKFQFFGGAVTVFFFMLLAVQIVLLQGNESLAAVKTSIRSYQKTLAQVQEIVPKNALMVTEYNDKIFFPEYRVIVPTERKKAFSQVTRLLEDIPVWYYTLASPDDVAKNKLHLVAEEPLDLRYATSTAPGEYLYEVVPLDYATHNEQQGS